MASESLVQGPVLRGHLVTAKDLPWSASREGPNNDNLVIVCGGKKVSRVKRPPHAEDVSWFVTQKGWREGEKGRQEILGKPRNSPL